MSRDDGHQHTCAVCGRSFPCHGTWIPNADCPPYCDAFEYSDAYRCLSCRGIDEDDHEDGRPRTEAHA